MYNLEKYGFQGVVIAGLCWFVIYLLKSHKAERKEFRETIQKQFDMMRETEVKNNEKSERLQEKTNDIARENTNVLSELTTLLKHNKK